MPKDRPEPGGEGWNPEGGFAEGSPGLDSTGAGAADLCRMHAAMNAGARWAGLRTPGTALTTGSRRAKIVVAGRQACAERLPVR